PTNTIEIEMRLNRTHLLSFLLLAGFFLASSYNAFAADAHGAASADNHFPLSEEHYQEVEQAHESELGHPLSLSEKLKLRSDQDPFNIIATIIFVLAICHTFVAGFFQKLAHKYE